MSVTCPSLELKNLTFLLGWKNEVSTTANMQSFRFSNLFFIQCSILFFATQPFTTVYEYVNISTLLQLFMGMSILANNQWWHH